MYINYININRVLYNITILFLLLFHLNRVNHKILQSNYNGILQSKKLAIYLKTKNIYICVNDNMQMKNELVINNNYIIKKNLYFI